MRQVTSFPANYTVDSNVELPPAGGDVVAIKRGSRSKPMTGLNGPLLSIEPGEGSRWLACFSRGYDRTSVVDGVFTTPNADVVCVVSQGAGYWVHTVTRESRDIPIFPIRQMETAEKEMLFVDFTRLAAFNSTGMHWISETLVSDQLVIVRIDLHRRLILCRGWKASAGSEEEFAVELDTGKRS